MTVAAPLAFWLTNSLTALAFGLLLFMLSAGLTLVFSLMGVMNFAHASFYMLGAYAAFSLARQIGFWPALVIAPLAVALVGAVIERAGLRRLRTHGQGAELLFTFGLAYLCDEIVKLAWGLSPQTGLLPAALDGPLFTWFGVPFPRYRAFMMAVSVTMLVVLTVAMRCSRTGLVIEAARTHADAVAALGYDVDRIFTFVFALGAGLAALAGVVGGYAFVVEPTMAASIGPIVFVVAVVGGLGSLRGAFFASLAIGGIQTFAVALDVPLIPATENDPGVTLARLAPVLPYVLLIVTLLFRPNGWLGARLAGGDN
ncbi:branched-chain amino acid ABC transporter permease [Pararobbsia silviterrae]|uniref:Branched-chain amino acid ABC transporter permease n=1 Tax=Pararobbsia silviterrae TaxID=1792498 RepID=A0A494XGF8_9BURK|nr:branched-chain amino acid ABC transporter permease [Pararobbsia silviterrae]RKP49740.1 branched-chain amino acid ABC transporter permease [Pararobbsia silviterrae]